MGYQEKRVWIIFATQLTIYGTYFWTVHHRHVHLVDTLHIVLGMIVLQIVLQTLLSATHRPERRDERDRLIENRSYKVGYFVLLIALAAMIAALAHHLGFSGTLTTFTIVNTLLFVSGIADLSRLLTQTVLYRRTA